MRCNQPFPGCSSIDLAFEAIYISGMHTELYTVAEILGLQEIYSQLESKYLYEITEAKFDCLDKFDDELNSIISLGPYYSELRSLASRLPEGSKVLEIGSYIGKSSLALAQGCSISKSTLTSIDLFMGFDKRHAVATNNTHSHVHWEYNQWQLNLRKYSNLIETIHGKSIPALKMLISRCNKYDLIFLDSAHQRETHAELALISCLANHGALMALDDVISYNNEMTSAWLEGLNNYLSFPSFSANRLAICGFKTLLLPLNMKVEFPDYYDTFNSFVKILSDMNGMGSVDYKFSNESLDVFVVDDK